MSNGLGAFKLVLLSLVVCTGFAALSGKMAVPSPNNFSSFHGPGWPELGMANIPSVTGGYALAMLQVLYSYSGWENANYVSSSQLEDIINNSANTQSGLDGS